MSIVFLASSIKASFYQNPLFADGVDEDTALASRTTPTPTPSSKESVASGAESSAASGASDDWEKEMELELTEEEKNLAEKLVNDGKEVGSVVFF